jgi:hypothetical protein
MGKIVVQNMPRLKLADLLRRRKMTLTQLCDEFGITTYEGLVLRCNRMGCAPPDEADFTAATPRSPVNSPQEGVIVLEPPPVIDDITGHRIDPEAPAVPEIRVITVPGTQSFNNTMNESLAWDPPDPSQKKLRRKKEVAPPPDEE